MRVFLHYFDYIVNLLNKRPQLALCDNLSLTQPRHLVLIYEFIRLDNVKSSQEDNLLILTHSVTIYFNWWLGIFIEWVVASIKRLQLRISLQIWFQCRCTWVTKKNPHSFRRGLFLYALLSIQPLFQPERFLPALVRDVAVRTFL